MRSLGGVETCSADLGRGGEPQHAKLVLVEQATRLRLILDSVDGWLFAQRGLVNRRTRSLLPALRERVALVTALLVDLGLKRRAKTLPTAVPTFPPSWGQWGQARLTRPPRRRA